jgi:Uma2 family endonuclease
MVVAQRMSEEAYRQFVAAGDDGAWELHDGRLVEKPGMSFEHGAITPFLSYLLLLQLDHNAYTVVSELRVSRPGSTVFMPDLMVVPAAYRREYGGRPGTLAIFTEPVPLVVEVWSPSTGDYDVDTKIPVYQQRGDLEIWRIHPYERTLTRWVRQPEGSYQEDVLRSGIVSLAALPGVTIDLDVLFGIVVTD